MQRHVVFAEISGGFGKVTNAHHQSTSANEDGSFARIRAEGFPDGSALGFGASLESFDTQNEGRNDLTAGDYFLHATTSAAIGKADVPIRYGVFFGGVDYDNTVTGSETEIGLFGVRVAAEPTLTIYEGESSKINLRGFLQLGLHYAAIDYELGSNTAEVNAFGSHYGLGAGIQAELSNTLISLEYLFRSYTYRETDEDNNIKLRGETLEFDGVVFSVGLKF